MSLFNNVYEISEKDWEKVKALVSDKNSEIKSLKKQLQHEKTLNEKYKNEMSKHLNSKNELLQEIAKLKKKLETTNYTLNLMISKLSESYDMLEKRGLFQRKIKINEIDIENLIDLKV